MEAHPDDLTSAHDLTLVESARAGDRLSFGILYLRHHAAAWRMACVVSRFSPDAELAVIEGFTRVFSALPRKPEDFSAEDVTFRPYLLACVRQAALERARAAGRTDDSPAPLAGLAPDGELVLSSLEHHVARGALAGLPERSRTALWLSDVEAMTPAEIAAMIGGGPADIAALVAEARKELQAASHATLVGHEVRAECRFTVAHLEPFEAGTLDPAKGVLVRSHLDLCPTCRMRFAELANGPATLAAAVPAAPLLGGEAQHQFLTTLADVRPANRLLPPGIAAAAPSVAPGHAGRGATAAAAAASMGSMASVAAGLSAMARRAGHRVVPAVPVVALVVAWLAVMLSLPQLMEPDTAPGPAGLALPAVQAYVPDYLPGGGDDGPGGDSTRDSVAGPVPSGDVAGTGGSGTELALQLPANPAPDGPAEPAPASVVKLAATTVTSRRSATARGSRPAAPAPPAIPVAAAVVPVSPLSVAAAASPVSVGVDLPTVTSPVSPAAETAAKPAPARDGRDQPSKAFKEWQRRLERNFRRDAPPSMPKAGRPDIASLRSEAREESDGRTARRETRRRHTDHAQSA